MISEKNNQPAQIIVSIHYQYFKNIAAIEKSNTANLFSILFIGTSVWKKIYFTPSSANFSQKPKKTDAGTLYHQTLQFNSPGENADDQEELAKLNDLKIVCRLEYSDGTAILIGTDKIPAYLSDDYSSDEKSTGSSFQITCKSPKRAIFLEI